MPETEIYREYLKWIFFRLRDRSNLGHGDADKLRDKFALALRGKLNVTDKDIRDAENYISTVPDRG